MSGPLFWPNYALVMLYLMDVDHLMATPECPLHIDPMNDSAMTAWVMMLSFELQYAGWPEH